MTLMPPIVPSELQEAWMRKDANEVPSPTAWRQLLLELRVARELAHKQEPNPNAPDGRTAILQALIGLNDFLNKHSVIQQNGLGTPFLQLIQAFSDLSNGHITAVLKPIPPGRGGLTRQAARSNITAIAARALHELMGVPSETRLSLDEASRLVARTIQVAKLPGFQKCSAATVRRWRDNILAGDRGSEKVAEPVLKRWHAPLPPEAGLTPQSRANFLLLYLRTSDTLHWE